MAKTKMIMGMLIITALFLFASALSGQNLLNNPDFQCDADGKLQDWNIDLDILSETSLRILPGQGVDGKIAIELNLAELKALRQDDLQLVTGEKYKISFYLKTDHFQAKRCGAVIYNYGQLAEAGIKEFPARTSGWQKIEQEITAPKNRNGFFGFTIYADNASGRVQICDISLVPLSEKAQKESKPALRWSTYRRIVPTDPLLTELQAENCTMNFLITGAPLVPEKDGTCLVSLQMADGSSVRREFPIKDRAIKADLGKIASGGGVLKVELREKATGKVLLTNQYPVTVRKKEFQETGKKLNVLVTELLNIPVKNQAYDFINPRDGWVYIALSKAEPAAIVTVGNLPVVRFRSDENSETMRYLAAGPHQLKVSGIQSDNTLIVRAIPELLLCPFNPVEKTAFSKFLYDMEFYRRYLFPAGNLFNSTYSSRKQVGPAALEELQERGIRLINNESFVPAAWTEAEAMEKSLRRAYADGRGVDEIHAGISPLILHQYSNALWNLQQFDKLIYTWCEGRSFVSHNLHSDLFSASTNVGGGKGKLLIESYVRTRPGNEGWKSSLEEYFRALDLLRNCAVNPNPKIMFINGGYITAGRYNTNCYPDIDVKYLFDRFYHALATDKRFDGLYGTGYYGFSNSDEELVRWTSKLLRHYFIEGNTDILSEKYHFTYLPGHLKNCDFKDGFQFWEQFPAETGSLRSQLLPEYGSRHQRRRNADYDPDNGDTTVCFTRSAKAPNRLKQTAGGLVPGKMYSLTYVTADLKNLKQKYKVLPPCVLTVSFDGADAVTDELSYIHRRPDTPTQGRSVINTHRVLFKAQAPEVTVTFSDWVNNTEPGAPIGQEQVLNFISLRPYFEE